MFASILRTMPPSANYVFYVLQQQGPMPRYRLLLETNLSDRTLGYALELLLEKGLVIRMLDSKDARIRLYAIVQPKITT
ncbi:MAG: MarR family transcriptional regulator [Candidatus Heimdallarchaeota archaeon]|nr:MarR family transcriptional regulator [Candidatus Heimdallarchaeota archaeon]